MSNLEQAIEQFSDVLWRALVRGRGMDVRAAWLSSLGRTRSIAVGDVAATFGMPLRSLHAWSVTTLGLGTRRFLKIRRLHAALELRLSGEADSWARAAADAGYADQSHLVRDCTSLLGESPSWFAARADSFNRAAASS
jgi:AraC-like DNA-binding protein